MDKSGCDTKHLFFAVFLQNLKKLGLYVHYTTKSHLENLGISVDFFTHRAPCAETFKFTVTLKQLAVGVKETH